MTIGEIKKMYYEEGLSCREIGEKTNKTVWQIISLMKKYNLKLRSSAETLKIQFLKKPLSFKKQFRLTQQEQLLLLAGLMLYWAEGNKTGATVDLSNSNERIILIFLTMLRKVYHVDEKKIRILIYCYINQNSVRLINYWSKKLDIPKNQFIKPYIRKDFNQAKINKMLYGLVHIRYNDKRLLMKIWEEIDIIANRFKC